MEKYVLVRNDGAYVTPPGSERSYTNKLENARTFDAREQAERERCPENETVCKISDLIGRGQR